MFIFLYCICVEFLYVYFPVFAVASYSNDAGDRRVSGETAWRPECQVYTVTHARLPGTYGGLVR